MEPSSQITGRYTKLGSDFFDWEPLRKCSVGARYLWLAIYASGDAKNSIPGMLRSSVRSLAETAHMQADDVLHALSELVDAGLAEHDQERRIIRLTTLPDRHERCCNDKHLKGWWSRFQAFPDCAIRNAHLEVLRFLCHNATERMIEAWEITFGTISLPVKRRRGRQRFDSDTSTPEQPSLFTGVDKSVDNIGSVRAVSECDSASETTIQTNPTTSDTVSHTHSIPTGTGIGEGISSSGSEIRTAEVVPSPTVPEQISLRTVPLIDLPFSIPDALGALAAESAGRFAPAPYDQRLTDALSATIRACAEAQVGLEELRVVGRWFASGGLAFRSDLGPGWVAKPGNLLDAVGQARAWAVGGWRRDAKRSEPAPASAFGAGRRRL